MSDTQAVFDARTQPLPGRHAIEASAGTGKTFSITLLWLRLLVEEKLSIDQILVTTFTNAATAELQERLLSSLRHALIAARESHPPTSSPEADVVARTLAKTPSEELISLLQAALSNFDLAPIHTIHGFCQSLISRHAVELGCDPALELIAGAEEILDEVVADQLMRDADYGLMDPGKAAKIAACLAGELSVPDDRVLGRTVVGDASDHAHELALADLAPGLPNLTATLTGVVAKGSIAKTERVIRALAAGDQSEKLAEAARDKLRSLPTLLSAIERTESCLNAKRDTTTNAIAAAVRSQFPQRKLLADLRTFDDILLTIHNALDLQGPNGPLARAVRARFKAAIIDECQDSDSVQIGFFQTLFSDSESFLVIGDPKQSIYRFRGADLASYQRLTSRATRAPEMTRNFRSDDDLVNALNDLYTARPDFRGAQPDAQIRYVRVKAEAKESRIFDARLSQPLALVWAEEADRGLAKHAIARDVATEFQRLLSEDVQIIDRQTRKRRRLVAADLAVLAANHHDLSLMRTELQARGIACQQSGKGLGSVWQSDEALDVQAWLEALATLETRIDVLKKVLTFAATPLLANTATELEMLRQNPAAQAKVLKGLQADLDDLHFHGPLPFLQKCCTAQRQMQRSLGHADGERRMTNWRHLGSLIQGEWARGQRRASELAEFVARQRAQSKTDDEADLMKLETDLPAVQLMTIHSAKGLEFPVVACPFLWHVKALGNRKQNPVALVRAPEGTLIDFGSANLDLHLTQALEQENDEQQRHLYVALTRARHRLYLGLAPVAGKSANENSAADSELVKLLGLAAEEASAWPSASPVQPLALKSVVDARRALTANVTAHPLVEEPKFDRDWQLPLTRVASYSSLTKRGEGDAHDHDPEEKSGPRLPGLLAPLGKGGNRLGDRVHTLLENVIGDGKSLEEATEKLDPAWRETMQAVLDTNFTFDRAELQLGQLGGRAIAEMHFLLPVTRIEPADLSKALLADPLISGAADRREWAEGIASWPFKKLQGFMQGYVDLIFEHDGKWFVVDYKTNSLPGYDQPELDSAMLAHQYLLQARLYAVALHRHLRATLAGYDAEQHLGGCGYLFLRGFPAKGVWFEKPGLQALTALDQLFAEAQP